MQSYQELMDYVMGGVDHSARGLPTMTNNPITIHGPVNLAYVTDTFNPAIAVIEALNMIVGKTNRHAIQIASKDAIEGGYFDYANVEYGERLSAQFDSMILERSLDIDTRRSIGVIATAKESPQDRPCPTTVQLSRLEDTNRLHLIVTMRSWDLIRGLPYDWLMWSIVAQVLASAVAWQEMRDHVPPPVLTIFASVPHVYLADEPRNRDYSIDFGLDLVRRQPQRWHAWKKQAELSLSDHELGTWLLKANHPPTSWGRAPKWLRRADG